MKWERRESEERSRKREETKSEEWLRSEHLQQDRWHKQSGAWRSTWMSSEPDS
ncbi:hypothetical protein L861_14810 [Litchfieldella anticariensis FP35 = DSM 16096]|uniref:Uncharacterized protein n=1 Tax=Litchfieldella anticariensis (strain DSM 16096 / CECT 5854 / CIP 108499 / LMG 22089 / FP35) TaxID=1121939 RepID=S2L3I1_LITA3|nr:hypothetical protein L861_14810 [Halomonas anticariensis FP35 = DSM 16096]